MNTYWFFVPLGLLLLTFFGAATPGSPLSSGSAYADTYGNNCKPGHSCDVSTLTQLKAEYDKQREAAKAVKKRKHTKRELVIAWAKMNFAGVRWYWAKQEAKKKGNQKNADFDGGGADTHFAGFDDFGDGNQFADRHEPGSFGSDSQQTNGFVHGTTDTSESDYSADTVFVTDDSLTLVQNASSTSENKILTAVKKAMRDGVKGKHCWDWCWQVFNRYTGMKSISELEFLFIGSMHRYKWRNKATAEFVKMHDIPFLPVPYYNQLRPGDWLYIFNRNTLDKYGEHSFIFIGWADKEGAVALVADHVGVGNVGKYRKRNLLRDPVTHWMRHKKA